MSLQSISFESQIAGYECDKPLLFRTVQTLPSFYKPSHNQQIKNNLS